MTETILEIKNLKKSYGENQVLKDISLTVHKGEVISIIGSSGSGKSTFLRSINLLETPTAGEILYRGKNVLDENYDLTHYREKLGMVFQSFNLFENLNVLENTIVAQTTVLKRERAEAEKIAKENLEKVGMGELYFSGNTIATQTYQYFQTFTIIAVIYFVLTFTVTRILRFIEQKFDTDHYTTGANQMQTGELKQ